MSNAPNESEDSPDRDRDEKPADGAALDFRAAALFLSALVPRARSDAVADDMQEILRSILMRGDELAPRPASAWKRLFNGALGHKRRERVRRAQRIERRLAEYRELRRRGGLSPSADAEFADAAFAALLALERDELTCVLRADWLGQTLRQIAEEVFGNGSPAGIASAFRCLKGARGTLRRTLSTICPQGLRSAEFVADHGRLANCLAELSKALRLCCEEVPEKTTRSMQKKPMPNDSGVK